MKKKSTQIGAYGEDVAEKHLVELGHKIVSRNWRTRFCEIDLITEHNKIVYFVEVKYRKSSAFGDGFAYITPKKQKQMAFAAEMWLASNQWSGEVSLAAMSITGGEIEFIDTL